MPNFQSSKLKTHNSQKGFTLIELLVVIVIIGILAGIGLRSFVSSQVKSRDSRKKSDLHNIVLALETYYNDKGHYPVSSGGEMMACGNDGAGACEWGSEFSDENGTIYMVKLPEDTGSTDYYYVSQTIAGKVNAYQVYARLENTLDKDVPKTVDKESMVYSGTDCGGGVECNYGVASTNSTLGTTVVE